MTFDDYFCFYEISKLNYQGVAFFFFFGDNTNVHTFLD